MNNLAWAQKVMQEVAFYPLGDAAIVLEFGYHIDRQTHLAIQTFTNYLDQHLIPGLIEYVPAFTTLTVYYDPWVLSQQGQRDPYEAIAAHLQALLEEVKDHPTRPEKKVVEIPVCYGGKYGPDLEAVAQHSGVSPEKVIALHARPEYLVYMIGFAPGFPYLGGMDEQIATPRKEKPRTRVPAGSVGIADKQTGVYPIHTPGGWQLIGRTPLTLFNPRRELPSLLQPGDYVRFVPITEKEYESRKEGSNGVKDH